MDIPGFRLESLIGRGGMAAVYLAVQESLDRQVALKVLDQTFADDPSFSERFVNEGRIIASLNHTNIITIYDVSIVDGLHYISMEYVNGGDLKSRITKGVDNAHIVDGDDVAMAQGRDDAPLVEEALRECRVVCEGLIQYLKRDLTVQGLLDCQVDGGHATSADQAL